MGNLIRLLPWLLECLEGVQKWWKKRKRTNEVNAIEKAVDTSNDDAIVKQLRDLAKKIEDRRKSD